MEPYVTRSMGVDLKQIRLSLGLTQQALATRLSVSSRTISRWESGGVMHWIYTLKLDGIIQEHHAHAEMENTDAHEAQGR